MATILSTQSLSKNYGAIPAAQNLSLTIPQGAIYGLLGPNGSGKTTTLGMVLGIIEPSSGSYQWFEGRSSPPPKQRMGALLETPNFYPYLSARENLRIVATIKGLKNPDYQGVLEKVQLQDRASYPFKTFSLGMKQRLALASALLCDPEVLVLDEPTNGLDPQGIAEVRSIIQSIAQRGITVLLASHILAEVEKICDHVAVLRQGKLLFDGPTAEMIPHGKQLELVHADGERLRKALQSYPGVLQVENQGKQTLALLEENTSPAQVNQFLAQQDLFVEHLYLRQTNLEEEFLKLIQSP